MIFVFLYLLIMNALTVVLMYADKKKARRHSRRIPEKVLLGAAILGGSLGMLLSMEWFHHKTRHSRFRFVAGISFLAHLAVLLLIIGCL